MEKIDKKSMKRTNSASSPKQRFDSMRRLNSHDSGSRSGSASGSSSPVSRSSVDELDVETINKFNLYHRMKRCERFKDKRFGLRVYKDCIRADEFIDWLLKSGEVLSSEAGTVQIKQLKNDGLMDRITDVKEEWYQLILPTTEEVTSSSHSGKKNPADNREIRRHSCTHTSKDSSFFTYDSGLDEYSLKTLKKAKQLDYLIERKYSLPDTNSRGSFTGRIGAVPSLTSTFFDDDNTAQIKAIISGQDGSNKERLKKSLSNLSSSSSCSSNSVGSSTWGGFRGRVRSICSIGKGVGFDATDSDSDKSDTTSNQSLSINNGDSDIGNSSVQDVDVENDDSNNVHKYIDYVLRGESIGKVTRIKITLDTHASSINDFYKGMYIKFIDPSSSLFNYSRKITKYDGEKKIAAFVPSINATTAPEKYEIYDGKYIGTTTTPVSRTKTNLSQDASDEDNFYVGLYIRFTESSSSLFEISRKITTYKGETKQINFVPAVTATTSTEQYQIFDKEREEKRKSSSNNDDNSNSPVGGGGLSVGGILFDRPESPNRGGPQSLGKSTSEKSEKVKSNTKRLSMINDISEIEQQIHFRCLMKQKLNKSVDVKIVILTLNLGFLVLGESQALDPRMIPYGAIEVIRIGQNNTVVLMLKSGEKIQFVSRNTDDASRLYEFLYITVKIKVVKID